MKNPSLQTEEMPAKRFKSNVSIDISQKNPVSLLNELRPNCSYTVDNQKGPVHAPIFTISVVVDNQKYEGRGSTKKKAKAEAAKNALRSFIQIPTSDTICNEENIDFTVDCFDDNTFNANNSILYLPNNQKCIDFTKGPVMLLNELKPGLKYNCSESKDDNHFTFKTTVTIDNEIFVGTGSNKKAAKNAAAKAALINLCKTDNYGQQHVPFGNTNTYFSDMPQDFVDYIGRAVNEKFLQLMENDPLHCKRKVLAGIVMQEYKNIQVIAISTGTKCVSGEHMSMQGASLNDMHAEVIARRCFLDYLYSQLELLTIKEKASESIFIPREEENGYKLKSGIKFHLFINTAPCGDARIFSPRDNSVLDKHPNRKARGQLRTKIESGEGTIPVKSSNGIQTWDGIIMGERLLTMSCSDKIAKWNVVGLQGSLLSHFIEPIYLESIILGSLLHPNHLYRAICGRMEDIIVGLPPPYRLNRPLMNSTTSSEMLRLTKAPNFCVNWTITQDKPEIVNTLTGKLETKLQSRICKRSLFSRFLKLLPYLKTTTGLTNNPNLVYSDVKNAVKSYNTTKIILYTSFLKADLGAWIKKPIEQDEFYINDFN